MRVLDLFAGLGGWSTPFAERGHEVVTVDIESRFGCTYTADVLEWEPEGDFDIVLASPPCEKFSVMTFGRYWLTGYRPRGDEATLAIKLVRRTVDLIDRVVPSFWIVENPVGMLRKLHLIAGESRTVTYCRYGSEHMKPTDLWGGFPPTLEFRPRCRNGNADHDRAPRGWTAKRTVGGVNYGGTQGMPNAAERALIPPELALDVCLAAERDLAAGLRAADYTGRLFA